jgi:hypothetical protein
MKPACFCISAMVAIASAALPARADSISIGCPAQATGPGAAVSCTVTLSLGSDQIDNLTFGVSVTPNGSAPALASGRLTYSDLIGGGNSNTGGTSNSISAYYVGIAMLSGTVTLGTVGFNIPSGASPGQSYQVAITGASGLNDVTNASPALTIGVPPTVTLPGGTLTQQTIVFPAIPNQFLGVGPFTLNATATSGLPVSFLSNSLSVCTVSGTTLTVAAIGTCSITATQGGNSSYAAATPVTQTFTVQAPSQTPQTITFPPIAAVTLGVAPFALTATASSGLPVTFFSNSPSICTVAGATATILATGTCSITASQAGNSTYAAAAPVTQTFTVQPPSGLKQQTITFVTVSTVTLGIAPFALSATASSGLPVSFSSNSPNVCTVSGSTVTVLALGTCSVTASQAGNSSYAAAPSVTQAFAVQAAGPSLPSIANTSPMLSGFTGGAYVQDLKATGGTPPYTWSVASGSLPAGLAVAGSAITGSPTAAGTSAFTLQISDAKGLTASQVFLLTVIAGTGAAAPARVGVLPQFVAGGGWDMTLYVINTSPTASIPVRLKIYSDDGTQVLKATGTSTPAPTQLTVSQQGDQQAVTVTTVDRVLNPNSSLAVTCGLPPAGQPTPTNVEGWVDVLAGTADASGFGVNGFAVFRRGYTPGLTTGSPGFETSGSAGLAPPIEGTVPLQTQLTPSTLTLPFDNTTANQFTNAVAIGTLAPTAGAITATYYDQNGVQLGTQAVPLPTGCVGLCHTAFLLNYPAAANTTGTVVFKGTSLMGLGLRASPYGTLTDLPVIAH